MIIIKILVIVSSWPVGLGLTDNKNFRGLTQSGIGLSVPPGLFGQGRHAAPDQRYVVEILSSRMPTSRALSGVKVNIESK